MCVSMLGGLCSQPPLSIPRMWSDGSLACPQLFLFSLFMLGLVPKRHSRTFPEESGPKPGCSCSVAQSCLTPSDPMDFSLPGSSIHGIFQASAGDLRELPRVPLRGEGSCGGWKIPWMEEPGRLKSMELLRVRYY